MMVGGSEKRMKFYVAITCQWIPSTRVAKALLQCMYSPPQGKKAQNPLRS